MDILKMRFGVAGNPVNFFKSEFKKDRFGVLEWSAKLGLNAQERQMTYGARMKEEDAIKFGEIAKKFNIYLSVHGPYYVVLTSEKENVGDNSVKELIKTCRLAELMKAKRVVFHPGFGNNVDLVIKRLKIIEKDKPKNVKICPETMGKISQLGSLNDVLTICERTECIPCIDFAHIHARNKGHPNNKSEFRDILIEIEKRLGKEVLKTLHCHFYPIEYGEKGEKVHRAVMEKNVFPRFTELAPLIKEFNLFPVLISESKNSQDIGALEMKRIMNEI